MKYLVLFLFYSMSTYALDNSCLERMRLTKSLLQYNYRVDYCQRWPTTQHQIDMIKCLDDNHKTKDGAYYRKTIRDCEFNVSQNLGQNAYLHQGKKQKHKEHWPSLYTSPFLRR